PHSGRAVRAGGAPAGSPSPAAGDGPAGRIPWTSSTRSITATSTDRATRPLRPVGGPGVRPAGESSDEKSDHARRRSRIRGDGGHGPRERDGTTALREAPEPRFPVPAGARLPAAGGRPAGGGPRAVHAPPPGLPRHPAHLPGRRPRALRPRPPHGAMALP